MSPSIYLINPAADFPSYFGGEVFAARGYRPATFLADLTLPTLAALIPHDFDVRLCDEYILPIDFDTPAEFVAITGKGAQRARMAAIASEFRRRGKVVLIGGPYASLSPDQLRPYCDILVRGEVEDICEQLFADLREGRWKDEYQGGRPDLSKSPIPRWDLYPNQRAISATVQTSRGCPFECEYCDVIQYLGRKQRHKSVAQVLAELDEVYRHGYRSVFLADDNFTVWRARAKELLVALREWNSRQSDGHVHFSTQVSIDAADDEELLRLCVDAGLACVFIGLETPNEDSLREVKKRQNLRHDPVEQVERFWGHGISVVGGMIVGFDSDGPDIFERQFEFAMATRVPVLSAAPLSAPEGTPLHARLAREGRLPPEGLEIPCLPWDTNIVPRQMTREQLVAGMRWLCNKLYDPAAFGQRVAAAIDLFGTYYTSPSEGKWSLAFRRDIDREVVQLVGKVSRLGPAEALMLSKIVGRVLMKPHAARVGGGSLVLYQQIRHMLDMGRFWEPAVTARGRNMSPGHVLLKV
jgi:hypothetical protein